MPGITGIEIGPDYCVLVRARQRETAIDVIAVRVFESGEWPIEFAEQVKQLRSARRELGLPRRANLVAWAAARSTNGAAPEDVLEGAGFRIENTLTPSDALALLAWSSSSGRDSTVACLSINRHGAALAVVRNTEILYERELAWRIQASEQRIQAHLLRRYLYVAQLTPELRGALQAVKEKHGTAIESVVACGNVADLRSLTMPLIRELDIEIETLDSTDGLHATGRAAAVLAQHAPAIRVAGAAATYEAEESESRGSGLARWIGAAAAAATLMLAAGAAWWAFSVWAAPGPDVDRPLDAPATATTGSEPSDTVGTSPPPLPPPKRPQRPQPTMGVVGTERPEGESSVQPLPDPLPSVGGVLISGDRRLAVVDGSVVGIGDRIGPRTVAQIELDAVVLREPSGRQVRVPIRTRQGET